jgi:FkbM family methyltransferase
VVIDFLLGVRICYCFLLRSIGTDSARSSRLGCEVVLFRLGTCSPGQVNTIYNRLWNCCTDLLFACMLLRRCFIFPCLDEITSPEDSFLEKCVLLLISALSDATRPQHRLRCGCLGRKMRSDTAENGLCAVTQFILAHLSSNDRHEQCDGEDMDSASVVCADNDDFCEFVLNDDGEEEHVSGSIAITCHHSTAIEETNFIFNEIFAENAYKIRVTNCGTQHSPPQQQQQDDDFHIQLYENDIVVDVGANVGMFSIYCETCFAAPNALRIVAVEPIDANIRLLQQNREVYFPSGVIVEAAVVGLQSDKNLGNASTLEMTYFPRLPGNSCAVSLLPQKMAQLERSMNTNILASCANTSTNEINTVAAWTLTEILDAHLPQEPPQQRIALVKIDVEGSELDILLGGGISDQYWSIIDQIIVETKAATSTSSSDENILMLQTKLCSLGFRVWISNDVLTDATGNCLLFGSKYYQ